MDSQGKAVVGKFEPLSVHVRKMSENQESERLKHVRNNF